jgi:hypothetical protein
MTERRIYSEEEIRLLEAQIGLGLPQWYREHLQSKK